MEKKGEGEENQIAPEWANLLFWKSYMPKIST